MRVDRGGFSIADRASARTPGHRSAATHHLVARRPGRHRAVALARQAARPRRGHRPRYRRRMQAQRPYARTSGARPARLPGHLALGPGSLAGAARSRRVRALSLKSTSCRAIRVLIHAPAAQTELWLFLPTHANVRGPSLLLTEKIRMLQPLIEPLSAPASALHGRGTDPPGCHTRHRKPAARGQVRLALGARSRRPRRPASASASALSQARPERQRRRP